MMRAIASLVFMLATWGVSAQWVISSIPESTSRNNERITSSTAPITIPFWDDFSGSRHQPDTSLWETGIDIFVNKTLAKNAPTQGIATFDGLRASGQAHAISANFNGRGDSLISKPIDLSDINSFNRNSVYLSFYWQAQGNGEIPDSEDSIRLQLLAKIDTNLVWETRWVQLGGLEHVKESFTYQEVQINQPRYFHENFKIKFQSLSSLRGPFDTWNIDYVYLNEYRTPNDSIFVDRSPTGFPGPLFGSYYQITKSAFFNDPAGTISQQMISITNLNDQPQPTNVLYQIRNETSGDNYLTYQAPNEDALRAGEIKPTFGPLPEEVSFNIPPFDGDSMVISSMFLYNSGDSLLYEINSENDTIYYDIDLRKNDTLYSYYTLQNYYSYDDGTAEFAVGVNSNRGQVAMRYVLLEPDTLTHVAFYFPNTAPDATSKNVEIRAWTSLSDNGIAATASYIIQPPQYPNEFIRVKLNRPVIVQDTIYVGYQQFIDNYIGLGFDRNNTMGSEHIFSNVEGVWEQNTRLSGSMMIRPVFDDPGVILLENQQEVDQEYLLYPNPSSGILNIKGAFDTMQILDLMGKEVYSSQFQEQHDLQFLREGLYLLKINTGNFTQTRKLIIQK